MCDQKEASQLFTTDIAGNFPVGEIMDYAPAVDDRTAKDRFTSEEKKALDRSQMDIYNEVRCAAEAHRQVSSGLDRPRSKPIPCTNDWNAFRLANTCATLSNRV